MYFLNPRLAADIFDGEYIIANLDTGLYYSIQGIAVSMVSALPFENHNQAISLLANSFSEHSAVIETELHAILNELQKEDIIKHDDTAVSANSAEFSLPSDYVPSKFNRYADMQDLLMLDPIHDVDEEGWTVQKGED